MLSVHILPQYATNFSVKESNSNTSEKLHLVKLTLVWRNQQKKKQQKKKYHKPWISYFSAMQ